MPDTLAWDIREPKTASEHVVAGAAFLYERLRGGSPDQRACAPDPQAVAGLAKWRRSVSRDNEKWFENRLRFDGLNRTSAARLFACSPACGSEPPSWAILLDAVIDRMPEAAALSWESLTLETGIDSEHPGFGFDHLLAPFLLHARSALDRENLPGLRMLQPGALRDLELWLMNRLSGIARDTLLLEFSVRLSMSGSACRSNSADQAYRLFVRDQLRNRCARLFRNYPVLARLLAQCTEQWLQVVPQVLERLDTDAANIAQSLLSRDCLPPIARAVAGVSDPHRGGQTVILFQLVTGEWFVYKPRPVDPEIAFASLLAWVSQHAALELRHIHTLQCDGYGWQEYVQSQPCRSPEEVQRYFQRAGMLLCLMYVFGGNDCHADNILAHGEHPVLIDLETFLYPDIPAVDGSAKELRGAAVASYTFFNESVFRTFMLPQLLVGADGLLSPVRCGLATSKLPPSYATEGWLTPVNCDLMQWGRVQKELAPAGNEVYCAGSFQSAADFVEDIVRGFSDVYSVLSTHKTTFFAGGEVLQKGEEICLRYVFRATRTYLSMLRGAVHPKVLRSGMDVSIHFDPITRVMLPCEGSPPHWPIIAAEHEAMTRGDLPAFRYHAGSKDLLFESGECLKDYFRRSGLQVAADLLAALSERDHALQTAYIRSSFQQEDSSVPAPALAPGRGTDALRVTPYELLSEAVAIGERMLSTALTGTDGTASWITRSFDPGTRQWQLKPMEISLYDGLGGPMVFLAALAKATGERRFREGALAAWNTIRAGIYAPLAQYHHTIGAGLGIDSVLYSLVRVAGFLGESEFLHDAARLAREAYLPEDSEDVLDLMGGSAGRILALLALHSSPIGEDSMLDQAISCGDRLVQRRCAGPGSERGWKTIRNRLQTGFAHGAAGISYALAKLSLVVSNSSYGEAANEGCRFENSLFDQQAGNWPGAGDHGTRFLQTRWCYGAPGVGIGRLGMLPAVRASGQPVQWIYRDLQRALSATIEAPAASLDHVCCGNLSRVELLLVASEKLNAPEWQDRAMRLASTIVQRARLSGSYAMGIDPNLFLPSFHQGMAGIGYQFLRLALPGQFPSVLLWE